MGDPWGAETCAGWRVIDHGQRGAKRIEAALALSGESTLLLRVASDRVAVLGCGWPPWLA